MGTPRTPLLGTPNRKNSPSIVPFILLVSLVAIVGSIAFITTSLMNTTGPSSLLLVSHICDEAPDRALCTDMVAEVAPDGGSLENKSVSLLQMFLEKSASHVKETIQMMQGIHHRTNDGREQAGLADCLELMDLSKDRLLDSKVALGEGKAHSYSDTHTWLSGVLTNHVTCMDGLNGPTLSMIEPKLKYLISRAKISLAMVVALAPPHKADFLEPLYSEFPWWVTSWDRKLLEGSPNAIKVNVVVAKDGSGNYQTISQAVASAPDKGKARYVIHVKSGTYKENVVIGKAKINVMLIGDGMAKTIITGSKNVVDGSTTFDSATVAVSGDGFIAQDIWFQNTAGAAKHQAVALRVSADRSVIYRCCIEAFQDTLYTHTLRQFYRDCYITGTVDFIFGNAAVVFQNSKLAARRPMEGQKNMVTAQGRTDPNQNTGTSIQNCNVIPSSDLEPVKGTVKTFLGRPWKEYSRTVYMESFIDDHIDPAGWAEWSGDFALKTLYYGEYKNYGPGADTSKRVKWPGYHVITKWQDAMKFTVAELIQGGEWLKDTGVPYKEWL